MSDFGILKEWARVFSVRDSQFIRFIFIVRGIRKWMLCFFYVFSGEQKSGTRTGNSVQIFLRSVSQWKKEEKRTKGGGI